MEPSDHDPSHVVPDDAPASAFSETSSSGSDAEPEPPKSTSLSTTVSRQRTRECMQSMLLGDMRMLPALVLCVYNHLTHVPPGLKVDSHGYMQFCLGRAAEILTDLTDLVQESERAAAIQDRKMAKETAPQMIVHVCVFALGAAVHVDRIRPAAMWCAFHFFFIRGYELMSGLGRVLVPVDKMMDMMECGKWTLALVFLCIDTPTSSESLHLFSGFAIGHLLYRTLFMKGTRMAKVLNCVVCGADLKFSSLLTYTMLALRLLHSDSLLAS